MQSLLVYHVALELYTYLADIIFVGDLKYNWKDIKIIDSLDYVDDACKVLTMSRRPTSHLTSWYVGGDEDQFIHELKLAPKPSVILDYDYQLAEVESFCTEPTYHSIFGIDPTFNLGQFNLTVSTYKQF